MVNRTSAARTLTQSDMLSRIAARLQPYSQRVAALPLWEKISLGAVVLLAAFFNFYQLTRNGLGNVYYAAAVKSMLTSWHNFFFVAFDPGGFVSVDKPPVGLWLQAISAKLFGFGSFGLLLPQAIAGIVAVVLLYYLVRRAFGAKAGLLAGLMLALTPVLIVADRDNILDSILVMVVLLATWAVVNAAATGELRWLILGAVLIGVGFNVKMLEAYLVVPALGLVYLLAAPVNWRNRIVHLVIAGVIMAVISLSWSVVVDLTPASQRPYVGSSQTNSEIELAFGYNGIQRLTGLFNGGGGRANGATTATTNARFDANGFSPFENGGAGIARLFNPLLGQQVSWLLPLALLGLLASGWQLWPRRFNRDWRDTAWVKANWRNSGAATWQAFVRIRLNARQQAFALWGMWLLTMGVFFSIASFFHPYYLVMMAPAVCALAAIGAVLLWRDYLRDVWQGWLLPIAIVATGVEQWHILAGYAVWDVGLSPLVMILSVMVAAVLVVLRLSRSSQVNAQVRAAVANIEGRWTQATAHYQRQIPLGLVFTGVGVAALLLTPTIWSYRSLGNAGMIPAAGPSGGGLLGGAGGNPSRSSGGNRQAFNGGGKAALNGQTSADPKLVSFLTAHRGKSKFLVATTSSSNAEPLILSTGQAVMAMGGFSGSDNILTTKALQHDVANGTVRYFLLQGGGRSFTLTPDQIAALPPGIQEILAGRGGGGGFGGFGAASKLSSWVTTNCTIIPPSAWSSQTPSSAGDGNNPGPDSSGFGGFPGGGFGRGAGGGQQLYDCGNAV